jgi:hypothetical protein
MGNSRASTLSEERDMPLKTTFAYLGTDTSGAAVGMVPDRNDDRTAKAVGELITDGLLIQRLPIDLAKQAYGGAA